MSIPPTAMATIMVYPLDQYGLPDRGKPPYKPKIERWMLNNIRRAAPSIGKIVGKGKYARDACHTSCAYAAQPFGELGKQDNCQIAVTLSIANPAAAREGLRPGSPCDRMLPGSLDRTNVCPQRS